ncbi:hypothetical protein AN958_07751, partial [Leucoagaricus sp. SymC.cos]
FSLSYVLLVFLYYVLSTSRPTRGFHWDHIQYVYSFDESYSFVLGTLGLPAFILHTRGTILKRNHTKHGVYMHFPTMLSHRLMCTHLPLKTRFGGLNWVEYLTGCFEGLPANCPRQLWDFSHTYMHQIERAAQRGLCTHLFLTVPPEDRSLFAETVRGGPQAYKDMIELFNKKFTL